MYPLQYEIKSTHIAKAILTNKWMHQVTEEAIQHKDSIQVAECAPNQ